MSRSAVVRAALLAISVGLASGAAATAQQRDGGRDARPAKNPLEGNPQAISNGAAMFRNRCAGCHGPDAHGYLGPDLTAFWAAGGTDARMFDIVRYGVSGTEMIAADPTRVFDKDIWQVLAYVRTLAAVAAAAPTGDAANGERHLAPRRRGGGGADRRCPERRTDLPRQLQQLPQSRRPRRTTGAGSLAHRVGAAAHRPCRQGARHQRVHQARL